MADPLPFSRSQGAANDARIMQEKIRAAQKAIQGGLGVPDDTALTDEQKRARLEAQYVEAAKITATLAAISKAIPGPIGRVIGSLAAGVEKDPGTGKLRPGTGFVGNVAPSPIGFVDPVAYGLKRNFYLPDGITRIIPKVADRAGLGLPEQRAVDDARTEMVRRERAVQAVRGESLETLRDLVEGRGGFRRSGVVIATSEAGFVDLQIAARQEIERRTGERQPTVLRRIEDAVREQQARAEKLAAAREEQFAARALAGTELGLQFFTGLGSMDAVQAINPPDP